MLVCPDAPTIYCDVDDTLLIFGAGEANNTVHIENDICAIPHERHIQLLKEFKARGFTIVVWSAGGASWAMKAVIALGIEETVDICINKPDWYMDDLPAEEFMTLTKRIYQHDA